MKGLDLSKFTKIGSTEDYTSFKHKDGHYIKVAHKSLSPKMKAQVMAMGGEAIHKAMADGGQPQQPQPQQSQQPQDAATNISKSFSGASGSNAAKGPLPSSSNAPVANYDFNKPKMYADGTDDGVITPEVPGAGAGASAFYGTSMAQPQQATTAPGPMVADNESSPSDTTTDAGAQPVSNVPNQDPSISLDQPIQDSPEAREAYLHNEQTAMAHDLAAGHIKPETYGDYFANKKGPLAKIGTIFALMLGGAGAGLTHTSNIAMDMIDNEIKRDLEAQQHSAENSQNFLKINQANDLNQQQLRKMNADTNVMNQAMSYGQMANVSFANLVNQMNKLPVGSQKRVQMQQGLQAIMPYFGNKVNDAFKAASVYSGVGPNDTEGQTTPGQSQAVPPGQQKPQEGPPPLVPGGDSRGYNDEVGPLLAPDAEQKFKAQNPKLNYLNEPTYGALQEEYLNAKQAEKERTNVKNYLLAMDKAAGMGTNMAGSVGNVAGHLPLVGGAAKAFSDETFGRLDDVKSYNAAKEGLKTTLRAVLKDVPQDELDKFVETNAIKGNDPFETRQEKITNVLRYFKTHTRSGMLSAKGMTRP